MNQEQALPYKTAQMLSFLFHPVWMPTVLLILLFTIPPFMRLLPADIIRFDLMIVAINTLLIPATFTIIFYRFKIISSLQMHNRQERTYPLILYIIFTYVSYLVLRKVQQPSIIWQVMLVSSAISFFCLLVNFRWKISLHMSAIGGLSGMLFLFTFSVSPLFYLVWIISLLIAGVLGTSRLLSKQHSPAQVYIGFLGGFFIATFLLWYMS